MAKDISIISKNTLFLYSKQILNLIVGLYAVRVVLNVLGTDDYGIYNVVAGVVFAFGFINNSIANAIQRYFAISIGKQEFKKLSDIFSMVITTYIGISLFLILLSEIIGIWIINYKLNVPVGRESAVNIAFHCVNVSLFFTIISSPFIALLIAYEDMFVFSVVSVFESLGKLIIAFILPLTKFDKLTVYSIFCILPILFSFFVYFIFCKKKYVWIKFHKFWDKSLFKEMAVYTLSNLGGSLISIFKIQILNVVINQKFSSTIVAARGIATNISGIIQSFSINFATSTSPYIIKKYAQNQIESLFDFLVLVCKVSFFINFLIGFPVILEMEYLLKLWLKIPPEFSILFSKLVIIDCCIESLSIPLMAGIQATGKITKYTLVLSIFNILYLPACLIFFALGFSVAFMLGIASVFSFVSGILRMYFLCKYLSFSLMKLLQRVVLPIMCFSLLVIPLPYIFTYITQSSIIRLIITTFLSISLCLLLFYFLALNRVEKKFLIEKACSLLKNRRLR